MCRVLRVLCCCASAILAIACGAANEPEDGDHEQVAVRVSAVGIDETSRVPVILLEEAGGGRVLPIWIGAAEARSIATQIGDESSRRPNSHDLTKQLLSGLGAKVLRATVTELRGNTYYAVIRVEARDRVQEFDARPSDAIAVALRFDAPLFVSSVLFETRSAEKRSQESPEPAGEQEDGLAL